MSDLLRTLRAREVSEHLIRSNLVAQTYRIKVMQPVRRADDTERFGVVYVTDGDDLFGGYVTLLSMLQDGGEISRFILVGIGYENSAAADLLRNRDFYTHDIRALYRAETRQLADSPLLRGRVDLETITATTDAMQFLRFICEELMPFIESRYPVAQSDNSYCGYSAGGSFGLYALFTEPRVFRRYVLVSPATSCDGYHYGVELAKASAASGRALDARVFMSVGELEEFKTGHGRFDLVSGYYRLTRYLKSSAPAGLDLRTRLFAGETHATAWAAGVNHGFKTLFGTT